MGFHAAAVSDQMSRLPHVSQRTCGCWSCFTVIITTDVTCLTLLGCCVLQLYWITTFEVNPVLNLADASNVGYKCSGIISELQSENFDFYSYFTSLLMKKPVAPVVFMNVNTQ